MRANKPANTEPQLQEAASPQWLWPGSRVVIARNAAESFFVLPGVDDRHASFLITANVTGDHPQPVVQRGGRNDEIRRRQHVLSTPDQQKSECFWPPTPTQ